MADTDNTTQSMFRAVSDHRSLSEKLISQISDVIAGGDLKPGHRLPTERELADQFGVSRTVVRDAIKTLAGRGILRVRQGAGIFVNSAEDNLTGRLEALSSDLPLQGAGLRDLFEVRKMLEAEAAEKAAQRRDGEQVAHLYEIVEGASRHTEEPEVLSKRDSQFHVAVADASRNLVLVRVMLTLLDLLEEGRRYTLSIPGRAARSLEDHRKIVEAIEAADTGGARTAMLKHLESVEASITHLAEQEEGSAG